ncbi:HemY protein [Tranquillimonas rosea]|uniref:HemY protein n=1 Tax=Tranquillimonas rosea TaxID=641238 RepID=A0A1H9UDD8_9RHOB|nr:heme biosynthesis HemY N-terminal domain-containing protein [Tranquillimonas rosea]SES07456.1 HemY protein [Tranquillimonas rosea]
MLWSLLKIVLFVCVIAALALGAGYLMETDGLIRIAVAGFELNLGPLQAAIFALLLLFAVWLVLKLVSLLVAFVRFLNGDDTALSRYFSRNRERKGFRALADGMLALASGEGREALHQAAKAERYLHRPELTNLIRAQAAEMVGDRHKAGVVYKQLLEDDRTRFVGVRGLMKQKLEDGDTDTALKLAEKAFALKPQHTETQDILLRLQANGHDWSGARKTLSAKARSGGLPRDVHRRRDAVLALSEARDVFEEGKSIEARESAIEANRLSPDLIPAATMAARHYIRNDQPRYATRVLKKAWQVQPHPDLATAFGEIKPDETPAQRLSRFRTLTKINPDHTETKLLLAELHIAAEEFPQARRALGDLATTHPTSRSLTIMAAIAKGEGADEAIVRGWLARALTASRGPQWVCDKCQNIHGSWQPTCSNCGAFDTLAWKVPTTGDVVMSAGAAEMLPMIVGRVSEPDPRPVPTEADATPQEPAEGEAPATAPGVPPNVPEAEIVGDGAAETNEEKKTSKPEN